MKATLATSRMIASLVGFEDPAWSEQYYPDECPEEWRIAYFMNEFSAVYLPAEQWLDQTEFIHALAQELEPDFKIVIEFPPVLAAEDAKNILRQIHALKQNIACIIIPAQNISLTEMALIVEKLEAHPINFDCQNHAPDAALLKLAGERNVGFVWHGKAGGLPEKPCPYQVVRLPCLPMRELKSTVQNLSQNSNNGLFFNPEANSITVAKGTRTLLELMGLA